jgi:hypothetical protein
LYKEEHLTSKVILSWADNAKQSLKKSKDSDQIPSSTADDSFGSQSDMDEELEAIGIENRTKFLEKASKFIEVLKKQQDESSDGSNSSSSEESSSDSDADKGKKPLDKKK